MKLEPHDEKFLDLVADIGPKVRHRKQLMDPIDLPLLNAMKPSECVLVSLCSFVLSCALEILACQSACLALLERDGATVMCTAALASQILLETAMRNYTALSVGETIVIDVGGTKHWLDIVETRPEPAISLLGSLDLEVEFAPPKVTLWLYLLIFVGSASFFLSFCLRIVCCGATVCE